MWTPEETEYLREQWGTTTIKRLSQNLGRTESAIAIHASALGLGKWIRNGSLLSFREIADGMGYTIGWVEHCVEKGLEMRRKKGTSGMSYRLVELKDLWAYLKEHQEEIDFSRMEPGIFGKEPDWVADARRRSAMRGPTKKAWTKEQEEKLLTDTKHGNMTVEELADKYGVSCNAIICKLRRLGKYRPCPKNGGYRRWTKEERAELDRMVDTDMDEREIADALGRSTGAVHTELARRYDGVSSLRKIREAKRKCGDVDERSMSRMP